jgi:predicted nicotinamide N-methyase
VNALAGSGETGAVVWPSAPIIVKYLQTSAEETEGGSGWALRGASVLELGAGLGLVGQAAAVLGAAKVVLTDRQTPTTQAQGVFGHEDIAMDSRQLLHALEASVVLNSDKYAAETVVAECAFGSTEQAKGILAEHGPFDFILGSDITYDEQSLAPLASSLQVLCGGVAPADAPQVVLAHDRRKGESQLLQVLRAHGFAAEVVEEVEGTCLIAARRVERHIR